MAETGSETEQQLVFMQLVSNELPATIGRLLPGLFHEINNPLQSMRVFLALVLEELGDPSSDAAQSDVPIADAPIASVLSAEVLAHIVEYIRLSQQEMERILAQIEQARRLYRPQKEHRLNQLVSDALEIVRYTLREYDISLSTDLSADALRMERSACETGPADSLQLAVASILLNLAQVLWETGKGNIHVRTYSVSAPPASSVIEFTASSVVSIETETSPVPLAPASLAPAPLIPALLPAQHILAKHKGSLELFHDAETRAEGNVLLVAKATLPLAAESPGGDQRHG